MVQERLLTTTSVSFFTPKDRWVMSVKENIIAGVITAVIMMIIAGIINLFSRVNAVETESTISTTIIERIDRKINRMDKKIDKIFEKVRR